MYFYDDETEEDEPDVNDTATNVDDVDDVDDDGADDDVDGGADDDDGIGQAIKDGVREGFQEAKNEATAGGNPADAAGGNPADAAGGNPANGAGGDPADAAGGTPVDTPGDNPADAVADKAAESVADKAAENVAENVADAASGDPANSAAETPASQPSGQTDSNDQTSKPLNEDEVKKGVTDASNKNQNNGESTNPQSTNNNTSEKNQKKPESKEDGDTPQTPNTSQTPETPQTPDTPQGSGNNRIKQGINVAKAAKQDGVKGAAKEVAKEAAKEVAKKAIQKSGAMRFLAAIPPVALFWIAVAIVVIIIVVGVIMFIVSMPGMITGKLKELGKAIMTAFQSLVEGKQNVIPPEEVADVANYLENMGYDLKGEGFVSSSKEGNLSGELDDAVKANAYYDIAQDVWRDKDTDKIVDLNSEPILTYIVSDNLCYLIKNFNQNLDAATGGLGGVVAFVVGLVAVVACFIFSPIAVIATVAVGALAFATAGNPAWGSGLISIYHEKDDIGIRGGAYDPKEFGYIELKVDTKTLEIQRGWSNNAYSFSVDGWSGRYGMPLEFLLSLHIATKMPDLAIEVATSFDTDLELLLHGVEGGELIAGYKVGEEQYIEFTDELVDTAKQDNNFFKDIANGFWGFLGWLNIVNSTNFELYTIGPRAAADMMVNFGFNNSNTDLGKTCNCCSHITGSPASKDNQSVAVHSANHSGECEDCEKATDSNGNEYVTKHVETCPDEPVDDINFGDQDAFNEGPADKDKGYAKEQDVHYVCQNCVEYMGKIMSALKVIQDNDWESYTPYISKVTNHWFRDVYFVIEDPADTEVVKNDEDYYHETNERWTMYETYTEEDEENDAIPEGFAIGDYKLYEYDNGTYTLSTKTKEQVDEINKKIADGDTSVTKLIKKSLTNVVNNSHNRWTAYEEQTGDGWQDWAQLSTDHQAAEDIVEALGDPDVKERLFYKENRPNDIIQKEDGERGITNEKIKEMFINKKYYKYDGSIERATAINEDRQKVLDSINMDDKKQVEALNAKYNTDQDPRNEDLLGKVSLAKDSLTAFSILQNTKTLDADYIYRDFKELIVELDYFDKEDLSDKISTVMQWPLPETGASGWPIRKYEKDESFYGTLINSNVDLRLLTDEDVKAAKRILAGIGDEVEDTTTPDTTTSTPITRTAPAITMTQFIDTGYAVHKLMEDAHDFDYCTWHHKVDANGNCTYGADCNGSHCTNDYCEQAHCDHVHGNRCHLENTIEKAINGAHNTCCATFVSWVLQEAGLMEDSEHVNGAQATYDWCEANGWIPITDYDQMEAGDLLFNNPGADIGHVQMLGYDGEWLNGGDVKAMNNAPEADTPSAEFIIAMRPPLTASQPFVGYKSEEVVVAPVTGKIIEYGEVDRVNEETGKLETVEYIKIEAMHEYIYDTTEPKGEAFRNDDQYVGICKEISKDEYTTFENTASDEAKKIEGYDYFYDEYQGVIDGFVLYIEGFDLTLFDADGALELIKAGDTTSEKVTRYQSNEVVDLLDNLKEAQLIWQEDAKTMACPMIQNSNGEWYIKEGTVIGKTLSDEGRSPTSKIKTNPDGTTTEVVGGNGNYMRLILRDLEDSIVEDVETYFNIIESETNLTPQPYEQEDDDLELLGKFLHNQGACSHDDEVAKAIGYVILNRALLNFDNNGVTIKSQIDKYSSGTSDPCSKCIKNAEWCLTYDCGSVFSNMTEEAMDNATLYDKSKESADSAEKPWGIAGKSTNVPMTRDVIEFGDICHYYKPCWWWVDTDGNNTMNEHANDIFFCKKSS